MTGGVVLRLASAAEAVTGLALLAFPDLLGRLLFGEELNALAVPSARVAGAALVALGLACWPVRAGLAMLVYSTLAATILAVHGLQVGASGPLLWPAVALHAALSALLAKGVLQARQGP